MLGKILATITIIVPLVKGVKKIWKNENLGIVEKVVGTITVILPIIVGLSETWKKQRR
jgi:hypothetical protein